ncbi:MAG: radical SAM protein [Methanomicrobiales archaeon]|nr:radical SAM protein [Methanomicrobiales archaeon]MDI6875637.1 radical SAM protein [Methanomicrobiales archaeon]
MPHDMTAEEKAELISIGSADIDASLLGEELKTAATAGPGAGGESFFVRSGARRVRLSINPNSPIKVIRDGDGVAVVRGGRLITRGILEQPLCHCPRQAYITLSERCIYNCRFCPVPKIQGPLKDIPTVLRMVEAAAATGELEAIALTSGVADSPYLEAERAVEVVKALAREYDLPIGVSIYPTWRSSEDLFAAGATEIKYNVETMDHALFSRICPGLDHRFILESLAKAVPIFGRGRVASNFIIGLGEDDACVREGVTVLAEMGVIPILRPITASPLRAGEIAVDRPCPERMLRLSRMAKEALERHGLRADRAETMCLPCTGCDITPHRDV